MFILVPTQTSLKIVHILSGELDYYTYIYCLILFINAIIGMANELLFLILLSSSKRVLCVSYIFSKTIVIINNNNNTYYTTND